MFEASHVMARQLITFSPETTAVEAIRLLLENKISGAPVVDNHDRLVGIISEFQLLSVIFDTQTALTPVGELMTKEVITIYEDTPLVDVAQAFISLRIRRLPVLKDGKVVGQVSRRDVLRCVVAEHENKLNPRVELVHHTSPADELGEVPVS